jgi:hypothetical protein
VPIPRKTWAVPRPPLAMTPTFWREIKVPRSKMGESQMSKCQARGERFGSASRGRDLTLAARAPVAEALLAVEWFHPFHTPTGRRTGMLRWFQTLMLAMARIQARQRLFIIVPYGFFPDLIRHGLDPRTFVPIILLPKARSTAELASGFLRHANRGPGLARGVASFLPTNKGCTMG